MTPEPAIAVGLTARGEVMSLEGRIALVTGAGRGIGRAIALALASDGADVAINFRRDSAAASETAEEVRALGRRAMLVQAAVDDVSEARAMVEAITGELGPIAILVNNAGIASRGNLVADTDPDELARVLGVHALGSHHVTQAVLPSMRTQPRGDVIMISSAVTRGMGSGTAPYSMAKAAMEALAMTLANEERDNGIRVNVVAPGLVETEMGRRLVRATSGIEDMRRLDPAMPFGRVCQPEDVAAVVRFLVSEGAGYVSGQKIYMDGGRFGLG